MTLHAVLGAVLGAIVWYSNSPTALGYTALGVAVAPVVVLVDSLRRPPDQSASQTDLTH